MPDAFAPRPQRSMSHRILVVAGIVFAALALVGVGWTLRGALDGDLRPTAEQDEFDDELDEEADDLDAPIIDAEQLDVEAATTLLLACGCPLPADGGPLSAEHVTGAWANDLGEIVLIYDNGVEIYYEPEDLTEEEFIEQEREDLEDPDYPFPGRFVDLRRTQAVAADADEEGSALLIWKEGEVAVEMYGEGGQPVDELMALAESLRYSPEP